MKQLFLFALSIFCVLFAFGQTHEDSVKVYFHIGQWQFDSALDGNGESMDKFIDRVNAASQAQSLSRIVIRSFASPEGAVRLNRRLSERRGATIASLIQERTGLGQEYFEIIPEGEAWDELRQAVAADSRVPYRDAVLNILDNTPVKILDSRGNLIGSRKQQLMDLRGGRPWIWMQENIFPQLRNAVSVAALIAPPYCNSLNSSELETQNCTDSICEAEQAKQKNISEDLCETPCNGNDSICCVDSPACQDVDICVEKEDTETIQALALKTNLLYYGILMPNLELEWLINKYWSIAVEGNVAWWGSYKRDKSYRLALIDGEVRRWIKPRAHWHGMYVGVMAGGGWYDLLRNSPGYRGEGFMAGVTFGYMWPIRHNLSLEAGIGAGYMHTQYKEYEPIDGHHVYQRTKDLNYFGPLKLKFSIAWRFLDVKKNKITVPAL